MSTAHTRPIPHCLQQSTKPHSCPPSSSSSSDTSLAVKILRETCRALTHISAWLSGSRRRGQQWRRLRELTRISSAFWTACRSVGKLRILHSLSSSKSDRISCTTTHREYNNTHTELYRPDRISCTTTQSAVQNILHNTHAAVQT